MFCYILPRSNLPQNLPEAPPKKPEIANKPLSQIKTSGVVWPESENSKRNKHTVLYGKTNLPTKKTI